MQSESGSRLRHGNDLSGLPGTHAPFLANANLQTRETKAEIKQRTERHGEHGTEDQRKNKSFAERGEVHLRADGDESRANERARQCVRGETGNPVRVARITVTPAARATEKRKPSEPTSASGTSPLPENFFNKACARKMAQTEPAKVVMVAHVRHAR